MYKISLFLGIKNFLIMIITNGSIIRGGVSFPGRCVRNRIASGSWVESCCLVSGFAHRPGISAGKSYVPQLCCPLTTEQLLAQNLNHINAASNIWQRLETVARMRTTASIRLSPLRDLGQHVYNFNSMFGLLRRLVVFPWESFPEVLFKKNWTGKRDCFTSHSALVCCRCLVAFAV